MVLEEVEMLLQSALCETILTTCRTTVPHKTQVSVVGVLHVTADCSQVYVVNLNETITENLNDQKNIDFNVTKLSLTQMQEYLSVKKGRPRKDKLKDNLPKRKRGRPRKIKPLVEDIVGCVSQDDTKGTNVDQSYEVLDIQGIDSSNQESTVHTMHAEASDTCLVIKKEPVDMQDSFYSQLTVNESQNNFDQQIINQSEIFIKVETIPDNGLEAQQNCSAEKQDAEKCSRQNICPICGKEVSTQTRLVYHMNIHMDKKPYKCKICDKTFNDRGNMRRHQKMHSQKEKSVFKCQFCEKTFAQDYYRKRHEIQNHIIVDEAAELKSLNENVSLQPTKSRNKNLSYSVNCHVCSNTYYSTNELLVHMKLHPGVRPYKCSYCEKTFCQDGSRVIHERKHTGDRPYECFCGKSFYEASKLSRHKKTHTEEKQFECKYCGKRLDRLVNLKAHETLHTGEQPFQCSICGKRYNNKTNLIIHERTHTGEYPFQCSVCDKRFNTKLTLERHYMTHTDEKPFQCRYCGKKLRQKPVLDAHERSHRGEKPFKCQFCDKHFNRRESTTLHEKVVHLGEKPYKCRYCENAYGRLKSWKIHERTHTGEKPYKCEFCAVSFATDGSYKRHKMTVHKHQMAALRGDIPQDQTPLIIEPHLHSMIMMQNQQTDQAVDLIMTSHQPQI